MRIVKVKWIKDYLLEVTFDDGKVKVTDFSDFLIHARNPMSNQFLDIKRFKKARIDHGDLTWGNGEMDFSAESIYDREFVHSETKELKYLKELKSLLEVWELKYETKEEDRPILMEALEKIHKKIGILELHYQNAANSKLTLKIARLRGLGYCVFADVYKIGHFPELTLMEVIERADEGYRIEISSGTDGFTYWKVTGYSADDYDKFYRILEVLENYED